MNSKQSAFLSKFCYPPGINTIITQKNNVDVIYNNEIHIWKNGNYKIKALILGEAPRKPQDFFYSGNTGSFLNPLSQKYGSHSGNALLQLLRQKGIFVMDVYEFPIKSECYANDKQNVLFDPQYVQDKINRLFKDGLLDSALTLVVPRYNMLISRGILANNAFGRISRHFYRSPGGGIEPLGKGPYSNNLNPPISPLLPP